MWKEVGKKLQSVGVSQGINLLVPWEEVSVQELFCEDDSKQGKENLLCALLQSIIVFSRSSGHESGGFALLKMYFVIARLILWEIFHIKQI